MCPHKADTILLSMVVTLVTPVHGRLKQEDHEFPAIVSYIARLYLKKQKQKQKSRGSHGWISQ